MRSPSRASAREQDRKGRDSRSKRRPAQRASPRPDVASVSQQSLLLDTKRKQRREAAEAQLLFSRTVSTNSVFDVANSLTSFRWVVPTQGEVVLKIWFYSELPGTFAQTFNFELMGTRRLYQLACRGICSYPSICRDHMSVCIAAITDLWWRRSLLMPPITNGATVLESGAVLHTFVCPSCLSCLVFPGLFFPPARRSNTCQTSCRRHT